MWERRSTVELPRSSLWYDQNERFWMWYIKFKILFHFKISMWWQSLPKLKLGSNERKFYADFEFYRFVFGKLCRKAPQQKKASEVTNFTNKKRNNFADFSKKWLNSCTLRAHSSKTIEFWAKSFRNGFSYDL